MSGPSAEDHAELLARVADLEQGLRQLGELVDSLTEALEGRLVRLGERISSVAEDAERGHSNLVYDLDVLRTQVDRAGRW